MVVQGTSPEGQESGAGGTDDTEEETSGTDSGGVDTGITDTQRGVQPAEPDDGSEADADDQMGVQPGTPDEFDDGQEAGSEVDEQPDDTGTGQDDSQRGIGGAAPDEFDDDQEAGSDLPPPTSEDVTAGGGGRFDPGTAPHGREVGPTSEDVTAGGGGQYDPGTVGGEDAGSELDPTLAGTGVDDPDSRATTAGGGGVYYPDQTGTPTETTGLVARDVIQGSDFPTADEDLAEGEGRIGRRARELEAQIADETGYTRDEIAVTREGDQLVANITEGAARQEIISDLTQQREEALSESLSAWAAQRQAAFEIQQEAEEDAKGDVESTIEEEYGVDVQEGELQTEEQDGALTVTPTRGLEERIIEEQIEDELGADLREGDITFEREDGRLVGSLTEQGSERVQELRREGRLEDAGALERYSQALIGPPGGVEQTVRGAVGGGFEAVAGPPGGIERTIGGFVPEEGHDLASATSDAAGDVGSAVEGAAQPIIGPAGSAEQSLYEASDEATERLREDVIEPGAEVAGDVADFYRQGFGMVDPRTHLSGDTAEQTQRFVESGLDVVRGEEEEVREEGATEVAGEEVTRAVGSLGAFVTSSPRTIQRVGETALGAGEYAVTRNPGESVEAAYNVGEQTAQEVGAQAFRRPVYTATQLGATGGAFAAARRVGPRTSAATRGAIQPGEELLGKGGAAAFRAAPGRSTTRAGEVLFPRGEPLFASEEAALMVAGRARSGLQRGRRRIGEAEIDTGGRVRDAGASVRFESDPEAGFLEVDPELRQQLRERVVDQPTETIREAPARAREAGQEAAETVREAPGQIGEVGRGLAEDVRAAPGRAREVGSGAVETGRQRFAELELRAGDAGFRAGYRAGREVDRMLSVSPRGFMDRAATRARQGVQRGRQEFTRLEMRAGDVGYRAGERVGRGVSRIEDVSIGGGNFLQRAGERASATVDTGRQQFTKLQLQAEDAAYRAGFRTGRAASEASDRIRAVPSRVSEAGRSVALRSPSPTGDAALQQAFLRGSGLPFPDRPSRPGFLGAEIGQRARQEATSLRFGFAETATETRRAVSNLRDTTIRIGDAERTTLFDTETGQPAQVRSPTSNPLDIETDTETDADETFTPEPTETDDIATDMPGSGTRAIAGETGVSRQRVVARPETETETADTDPTQITRAELGTDMLDEAQSGVGTDAEVGTGLDSEVEMQEGSDVRSGLETEPRARLELGSELERELEREAEAEAEAELEQELEQEAEAEVELERELDPRLEAELGDDPDEPDDPDDRDGGRDISTPGAADADLGPGWYSEYVTALALGTGAARGDPGDDVLEDRPETEAYTSTLPTEAQVSGTEEEQEAIEQAQATLAFGSTDSESDGDGFNFGEGESTDAPAFDLMF